MSETPQIGDIHPDSGFTYDKCRKCGEIKWVDCMGYCTPCYPYGASTEMYKRGIERQEFGEHDHNICKDGHCSTCGEVLR